MIESSDHIIVGTIIERNYGETYRKVKISIETELKGKMNKKELILEADKPVMYGCF
jgi:hypothetical protein